LCNTDEKRTLYNEYKFEGEWAKRFLSPEYVLLAQYSFFEDKKKKHVGEFHGILKTNFYIYEDKVHYNDLRIGISDNFNNNQYVGIWRSFATGKSKICNWGEFRIPYSKKLDIGAGEFVPNPFYYQYGWETYSEANDKKEW
jgi:hypothetical protein